MICCMGFNRPDRVRPESMQTEILKYVNEDRKSHRMEPLIINDLESTLASKHSTDMATGKSPFGHEGFTKRAKTIMSNLGCEGVGENVAAGKMNAREVVGGWLKSPEHKKNIEGNFNLTGIGYAADKNGVVFFTEIFSR